MYTQTRMPCVISSVKQMIPNQIRRPAGAPDTKPPIPEFLPSSSSSKVKGKHLLSPKAY